jgi:hypothetical protein
MLKKIKVVSLFVTTILCISLSALAQDFDYVAVTQIEPMDKNYQKKNIKEVVIWKSDPNAVDENQRSLVAIIFFDEMGNHREAVFYGPEKKVLANIVYEYNASNYLQKMVETRKGMTIVVDKILFDAKDNIVSLRRTYQSDAYVLEKRKYDKQNLLVSQTREYFFPQRIVWVLERTYEVLGETPSRDSKKLWELYKYYTDQRPQMKTNTNPNITNQYCQLNSRGRITNIMSLSEQNSRFRDLSLKYDNDNKVEEAFLSFGIEPVSSFRYNYTYLYYEQ